VKFHLLFEQAVLRLYRLLCQPDACLPVRSAPRRYPTVETHRPHPFAVDALQNSVLPATVLPIRTLTEP